MSIFSKFPLKEKEVLITRTYEIDLSLYEKLEYLSNEIYDTSINKLVNTCIENLILKKDIIPYRRSRNEITVTRSFEIRKSLYDGLSNLRAEYNISYNRLINIAIRNALIDDEIMQN